MRRAIVVQGDYRFASMTVDTETVLELQVGDKVKVISDIEVDNDGAIRAGENATVSFVDRKSGAVELLFDRVLEALHDWRNCLLLVPFDTDDFLQGLALESCLEAKEMPGKAA